MQVIMKIAERQRKSKAGLKQLFNYISRDNFKCAGVGVSDNKEIAFKQFLINKSLFGKDTDNKNRFTYHQILSFGADIDKETVFKITEEYCQKNFLEKGFNSFFAIHTDKENIHCHILTDNVNFKTGKMLQSLTEKQYTKEVRKQNKEEVYIYEKQRELFENICIEHGLDISEKERYKSMHEQKQKEGRKWLTKEQYRAKQDKDSWSNDIKDRLEQIYKDEDITEDNIKDIAGKYGLEVTRHNRDKKYITFALLDEQGKRTNQKLKLVQELNKKKRKTQEEVTKDNVKLAVKLDTLEVQEKELKKDSNVENIFIYDNFFFKRKEIEKEQEEVKEINTYTVEDSTKSKDFEKEKEYKNILENFYEKQEEKKKEQDSKAKALEQEIKDLEKKEIEKITQSDEVLRRLNIEEEERQAESKAKKLEEEKKKDEDDDLMSTLEKINIALSKKPKIDNRPVIFDRLKDFKEITSELEILEFQREDRLTYSSMDIEKDFNNAVYLAFYSIISRKVEFNNEKEADRANEIMENVEKNNDDESIRRNLYLLDELIKDNEKEYERLKKNNWREEEEIETNELTDLETTKTNDEEKEIEVAEVESKQEITSSKQEEQEEIARQQEAKAKREQEQKNEEDKSVGTDELTPNIKTENETSKKVSNNQPSEITEFETGKSVSNNLLTNNEDLEKSIKKLSNNYSEIIIEKYNLYENLPAFKVYNENGSEIFNNKTGYIAEDYIISIVGQEYWDNMDINNIKDWENLGVIIAYGNNENQYIDYTDYAEETVINYLKSNPGKVKELELEFNSQLSTPGKNKAIEEEEKEIEKDDKEISI